MKTSILLIFILFVIITVGKNSYYNFPQHSSDINLRKNSVEYNNFLNEISKFQNKLETSSNEKVNLKDIYLNYEGLSKFSLKNKDINSNGNIRYSFNEDENTHKSILTLEFENIDGIDIDKSEEDVNNSSNIEMSINNSQMIIRDDFENVECKSNLSLLQLSKTVTVGDSGIFPIIYCDDNTYQKDKWEIFTMNNNIVIKIESLGFDKENNKIGKIIIFGLYDSINNKHIEIINYMYDYKDDEFVIMTIHN